MNQEAFTMINRLNKGIVQCRGVYSAWAASHSVSSHEMLVLYTIREYGCCTQKQVCDSYILPKQTIHNVISSMRERGVLIPAPEHSKGREKAFILSETGETYAADFLQSLDKVKDRALELFGKEKLQTLTSLLFEFDTVLNTALEETDTEHGTDRFIPNRKRR